MQRVLSYQTAVRANADEMDTRDYVSKRTCVSLVLSVAFFTMICGFLLGKFVSDRHHHIRQLAIQELNRNPNQAQLKTALALPAAHYMQSHSSIDYEPENRKIWLEFLGCVQHQPNLDYTQRLNSYVDYFVDHQFDTLIKCLRGLESVIEHYGKNSSNMPT